MNNSQTVIASGSDLPTQAHLLSRPITYLLDNDQAYIMIGMGLSE